MCVFSRSVVSDSLQPMDCGPPAFSIHGIFSARVTGVGCHSKRIHMKPLLYLLKLFPTGAHVSSIDAAVHL